MAMGRRLPALRLRPLRRVSPALLLFDVLEAAKVGAIRKVVFPRREASLVSTTIELLGTVPFRTSTRRTPSQEPTATSRHRSEYRFSARTTPAIVCSVLAAAESRPRRTVFALMDARASASGPTGQLYIRHVRERRPPEAALRYVCGGSYRRAPGWRGSNRRCTGR